VAALKGIDDIAAIPATVHLLRDPSAEVRAAAMATLRHASHMPWGRRKDLMADIAADLAPALPNLTPDDRADVLELMRGCRAAPAADVALSLCGDAAPLVRRKALEVLGTMGDTRALPNFVDALSDADESVCLSAIQSLAVEEFQHALRQEQGLLRRVLERLEAIEPDL
jgi:HEAT repeat protein